MDVRSVCLLVTGVVFSGVLLRAQEEMPVFRSTDPEVAFSAIHPDGDLAAVSYRDRSEVLLFDLSSGLPLQRLQWEGAPVLFLAFDRKEERLIGATPESVFLWRLSDFREEARLSLTIRPQGDEAPEMTAYVYDPDRQLLYRSYGSDLYCYSLRRKGLAKTLPGKAGAEAIPRSALLAQAPKREALWVLDLNTAQLRRIELEHFRETDRLDVPGATAFAVDNGRIAVLRHRPDSSDFAVDLLDHQLQVTASIPLSHAFPSAGPIRMAFTGVSKLSISAYRSVVDIALDKGTSSVFDFDLPYEELHFSPDGRLLLRKGLTMQLLDDWGRVTALHPLWAGVRPIFDPVTGERYLLTEEGLQDASGRTALFIDEEDRSFLAAGLAGGLLVLGRGDGQVVLYDMEEKTRIRSFQGLEMPVSRLVLAAGQPRIAVGTARTTRIRLLNAVTGKTEAVLSAGSSLVGAVALDEAHVYIGDATGTIRAFRLEDGRPEGAVQVQAGPVTALAVQPSSRHLLVGGEGSILRCSLPSLRVEQRLLGHDNAVRHLAGTPDGGRLISVAGDGALKIWDAPEGLLLANLAPSGYAPMAAFPVGGDGQVAVADEAGRWQMEAPIREEARADWSRVAFRAGAGRQPAQATLSPDGQVLAWAGGAEAGVRLWSASSGRRLRQWMPTGGLKIDVIAFLDPSRTLLLAGDHGFQYWDARSGELLRSVNYRASGLRLAGLCIDPRRDRLWAFQEKSDQVLLFDSRTGILLSDFHVREMVGDGALELLAMEISADGSTLAMRTDRGIIVYDAERNKPVSFVDHPALLHAGEEGVLISPQGRMLAGIHTATGEVVVYDLYQEREIFRAPGRVALFLDDFRLLTVREGSARTASLDLWNYLNGAPIGAFELESELAVTELAYSSLTRQLLTGSDSGDFLLWKDEYLSAQPGGRPQYRLTQALPLAPGQEGAGVLSFHIGPLLHFRFPLETESPAGAGDPATEPWQTPYRQEAPE